jgi:hypothetical protein
MYVRPRIPGCSAVLAAVLMASGCSTPSLEGGQFEKPPVGFLFDANASKSRDLFPDSETEDQRAWMTLGEDHNSIFITQYRGTVTREQVQAARDALESKYGHYLGFGNLEEMTIDGRPAWGWLETQDYKGECASLEYKAVVGYEETFYAVEFFAGRQDWRDENKLRIFVKTFKVGRTEPNLAAIAVGGLLLAGTAVLYKKTGRG